VETVHLLLVEKLATAKIELKEVSDQLLPKEITSLVVLVIATVEPLLLQQRQSKTRLLLPLLRVRSQLLQLPLQHSLVSKSSSSMEDWLDLLQSLMTSNPSPHRSPNPRVWAIVVSARIGGSRSKQENAVLGFSWIDFALLLFALIVTLAVERGQKGSSDDVGEADTERAEA